MSKRSSSRISKIDSKRLDVKRDDIDLSDIPEATPEMFARAILIKGMLTPRRKEQITLRLDADVLEWFRARGEGYQTLMNMLLRAYMDEHLKKPSKRRVK